jgi:NAD(P)-dependent dehydrogenase (short-subunit alcohol dehydrogenase family)
MAIFDLKNRVAFVTGGNGGIGLGMAKGLAGAGASIVIAGRNKTKAQSALSELRSFGAPAEFVDLDVLDETSCRQAIQNAVGRFGRLDILVNNAGTTVRKQPEDLTAQEWHLVMNTNLTGAFLCSQAAYPHMVRAGGGKIINIGSMMSVFASSYAAQCDIARVDRYRADPSGPEAGSGSAREGAGAYSGPALGSSWRFCGHCRVPGIACLGLRHWRGDRRRRRLFSSSLICGPAKP